MYLSCWHHRGFWKTVYMRGCGPETEKQRNNFTVKECAWTNISWKPYLWRIWTEDSDTFSMEKTLIFGLSQCFHYLKMFYYNLSGWTHQITESQATLNSKVISLELVKKGTARKCGFPLTCQPLSSQEIHEEGGISVLFLQWYAKQV